MAQVTDGHSKVALVTEANKGIGKAIVKGLACAGLTVYLGARA
jgi:NAD(P)-dependent dehydrogenase (short-subunit alcohol dehydrogenase family)